MPARLDRDRSRELDQPLPIAERARMIGADACPIEAKRLELAHLPTDQRLSPEAVATIRTIGDNTGCMALKGASPEHEGEERPDPWPLTADLAAVGGRWGIDPERDLALHH